MIYTPHGLKIRLEESEAFAYMGRLMPEITPKKFLLLLEGLESFPLLLTIFTYLLTVPEKNGVQLILFLSAVYIVTKTLLLLWQSYLLGRLCYYLTRWPIVLTIWGCAIYKLIKYNHWLGIFYTIGFFVLLIFTFDLLESIFAKCWTIYLKSPVTYAEILFFGFFRHTARFFDKNDKLELTQEELKPAWWRQFEFLYKSKE